MSFIPLDDADFKFSTPVPLGTGPLRLLTFESSATSSLLSLSLVDAKPGHRYFAISYAWDKHVCKPWFGCTGFGSNLKGSVSCGKHNTLFWTNNKALCNNYLTYHRNGPDGYVDILINGQKFYIQDTVYQLLLRLRASVEIQQRFQNGEYFWLDAICVNQNNKFETEQQTSIMHEIYKAAQHVYVWLGTGHNKSDAAMDFLYHLAPSTSHQQLVPHNASRAQFHSENQFWSLYYLFIRPYWKRTWVIQECLLARETTLLCGNKAVPWSKAESLVSQLDNDHEFRKRYPQWAATPAMKIIQARRALLSSRVKPSLECMIQHFLFSRSTFPEDKLIGLLNVSLSAVQTDFSGESGSIQKRVEVISSVVRASQNGGMNDQAAHEWYHLQACLLGVRGSFPRFEGLNGRLGLNSGPQNGPFGHLSLSQPRPGPAATSCPGMDGPRQSSPPLHAATSILMPIVGNVRSPQPAPSPAQLVYGNGA